MKEMLHSDYLLAIDGNACRALALALQQSRGSLLALALELADEQEAQESVELLIAQLALRLRRSTEALLLGARANFAVMVEGDSDPHTAADRIEQEEAPRSSAMLPLEQLTLEVCNGLASAPVRNPVLEAHVYGLVARVIQVYERNWHLVIDYDVLEEQHADLVEHAHLASAAATANHHALIELHRQGGGGELLEALLENSAELCGHLEAMFLPDPDSGQNDADSGQTAPDSSQS